MLASDVQAHVLRVLAGSECRDFPLTTKEIAERAGISAGRATTTLRRFEANGWAQTLGVGFSGGRTWQILPAGERVLDGS